MAAAKSADAIRQGSVFQPFALPDFDIDKIDQVLKCSLTDLETAAVKRVHDHIARLGAEGEAWIANGMTRIATASKNKEDEQCPFCAQELAGSNLITHYRAYFSQEYQNLKTNIQKTGIGIRDAHTGDIRSAFERDIRIAVQSREFWKDFTKPTKLPEIKIDTAAIAQEWSEVRESVLQQLRAKAAAPLESVVLKPDTHKAIMRYRNRIAEAATLSTKLANTNNQLNNIKERADACDLAALTYDLAELRAQKARFDSNVVPRCKAYLAEKKAKIVTEACREESRAALDRYRNQIFLDYETTINHYLHQFGASFRLGNIGSSDSRWGSSVPYHLVINERTVNVSAKKGPSFRNTLSAGDRNTLALAFFFASLDQDPDLANKIVVIDDAMTSLDEHRMQQSCADIMRMAGKVQQIIILSHSKPFLCNLWEKARHNNTEKKALQINRAGNVSRIAEWDILNDSVSQHDRNHELVREYLKNSDDKKKHQVAQALRPLLEGYMRVAFPEHFPPGTLLGPFIGQCRQQLGKTDEILSEEDIEKLKSLCDYANQFHHANHAAAQNTVNGTELSDFAKRTLHFISRR